MRRFICIVTVCFMILTVLSGCTVLQKLGLQGNDELRPVSSIAINEEEAKKLTDKVPIHLYFANQDNTRLKLEVRYIPISEAKKSVNNLASVIVKELIKGPSADSGLGATIPAEAKLRTPVAIKAGIATVDLSKEFVDKHPGGKVAEQLTIYSIVNSLTELKEIQKVKFAINGKVQKDFKGNFQFDVPFPRSTSMISMDVTPIGAVETKAGTDKDKKDTDKKDTTKKDTAKEQDKSKQKDDAKKQDTTKQQGTTKTNDAKTTSGDQSGDVDVNQDTVDPEAVYSEILE